MPLFSSVYLPNTFRYFIATRRPHNPPIIIIAVGRIVTKSSVRVEKKSVNIAAVNIDFFLLN